MLVAFSVAPSGTGREDGSVHDAVAAAVKVVRDSGLPNHTDSMFTTIEGEWDEVFAVIKRATDAVAPFDIRAGYTAELTAKVERLETALDDITP
jgi:uncharacterized protein YqgV (UPF0045/DUF77 family)